MRIYECAEIFYFNPIAKELIQNLSLERNKGERKIIPCGPMQFPSTQCY